MAPSFPVSRLLLPKVKVSPEEHRLSKLMMNRILQHTVHEFETFAYDAQGVVDTGRWKPVGAQDDLKLYKERVAGATSSRLASELGPDAMLPNSDSIAALTSPTMMMTGCCPGSVARRRTICRCLLTSCTRTWPTVPCCTRSSHRQQRGLITT
eukprot:jgi/Phyca11/511562/fgenesh2_kg.PHYCAscaffold_89_\